MEDALRFVIYALAVFRLTHMLTYEDGPFDLFDWLRFKVGITYYETISRADVNILPGTDTMFQDPYGEVRSVLARDVAETFFARLLDCPLCLSVWVSAVAMGAYILRWWPTDVVAGWLALSAVSALLFGTHREAQG